MWLKLLEGSLTFGNHVSTGTKAVTTINEQKGEIPALARKPQRTILLKLFSAAGRETPLFCNSDYPTE